MDDCTYSFRWLVMRKLWYIWDHNVFFTCPNNLVASIVLSILFIFPALIGCIIHIGCFFNPLIFAWLYKYKYHVGSCQVFYGDKSYHFYFQHLFLSLSLSIVSNTNCFKKKNSMSTFEQVGYIDPHAQVHNQTKSAGTIIMNLYFIHNFKFLFFFLFSSKPLTSSNCLQILFSFLNDAVC